MTRLLLLPLLGLPLITGCETDAEAPAPAVPAVPRYDAETFLNTTTYTGASFSPDNSRILVSSDASGIFNAYALPVDGGDPIQLTTSTSESIYTVGYFPADERFLYVSDQGGNELDHLFVREPDGTVTDLTPGEDLKAEFLDWAPDGASFFVESNERDARYFDVYEYTVDGYARTLLYENNDAYSVADVSPNRRYLALTKTVTNADSDLYLHDRTTGQTLHLTPHEGAVNHRALAFSPNGHSLYYLSDADHEYLYLMRYDLRARTHEIQMQTDWDLLYAYPSRRGTFLVIAVNEDARTSLRIYEADTMEEINLPALPDANLTSVHISRDEAHMAFYASSSRMPGDLFYYDFDSEAPRQLTRSLHPDIAARDLVEGEIVRFASFDGVEIPAILYKPHRAGPEYRVPALVWVHGGPGGQSRIGYDALLQYLVNHDYAVLAINNRGSSGYGKTFYHLDDRKHGTDDLDDCVAGKAMLAETGYVDPDRIGIIGGSYGGYMTLAALAFRPEAFAVGVDLFGISNWVRTLESIPLWWESFRTYLENEMGPFDDTAFFRAKSPLFHADDIVRPLMVLQGANDPRVLKAESDDIVAAVRANDVPVEYIVFEDEGHGFVKRENKIRGYAAIRAFLDQYLKGVSVEDGEIPS